jgi:adenylylsulfate kinase
MEGDGAVEILVITGPCGAGKSTVGFECVEQLERAGVACAFVDGELAYFTPKPDDDPFGYAVAEAGLESLWRVYAEAGHRRLLLARVVEDEEQLGIVERAVPGADIRLLRLEARPATIRARLEQREIGSGLEWHVNRAAEIAKSTLGEPVDAERSVVEIACDVLARRGWLDPA